MAVVGLATVFAAGFDPRVNGTVPGLAGGFPACGAPGFPRAAFGIAGFDGLLSDGIGMLPIVVFKLGRGGALPGSP